MLLKTEFRLGQKKVRLGIFVGSLLVISACSPDSAYKAAKENLEPTGSTPVADIVLRGGTVASMDPDVVAATAVAVRSAASVGNQEQQQKIL